MTGAYVADINNTPSTIAHKGLVNPTGYNQLGFAYRGGDLSGNNTPVYYKTSNNEEETNILEDVTDKISIFPNPNSGTFTLDYISETEGNLKITMYDVTGKKVFYQELEKEQGDFTNTLSPNYLTNGIYLISVELNGQIDYQKVIVQ